MNLSVVVEICPTGSDMWVLQWQGITAKLAYN
jgi:hypothetical protein